MDEIDYKFEDFLIENLVRNYRPHQAIAIAKIYAFENGGTYLASFLRGIKERHPGFVNWLRQYIYLGNTEFTDDEAEVETKLYLEQKKKPNTAFDERMTKEYEDIKARFNSTIKQDHVYSVIFERYERTVKKRERFREEFYSHSNSTTKSV